MELVKISPKISKQMLNKLNNIKKYNKNVLLDLLSYLNKKYFNIESDKLTNNLNLFFSESNLLHEDNKLLSTIISFQHIFITSYTSNFGLLTKKDNKNKFNEYIISDKIDKFIFDSCIITNKMYYINNTIYSKESGYYYFITLMITLNLFNINADILINDDSNLMVMKIGDSKIIKFIENDNIIISDFIKRTNEIYNKINPFLLGKIDIEDKNKYVITIDKVNFYNTEFGFIQDNKITLNHKHYNQRDVSVFINSIYNILYKDTYKIDYITNKSTKKKYFEIILSNNNFKEISWRNKNIVCI